SAIDADDPGEQKKKRTRKKESENEKPKRSSRSRKKAESSVSEAEPEPADNVKDESEVLSDGGFPDDAEASIRETPETAAMAVRRGGRGRRRGGRGKKKQASDSTDVSSDT
ncbi:hypothetical protein OFC37_28200, partial [Escherichia coli]|nr:hypothetical protein [Escherichia coli]